MAYTRYTKSNGSLRLFIDRMSLVICVICLVLSLALAFAGGYLAGFNSRAALMASAQRHQEAPATGSTEQSQATPVSAPDEPTPVDTSAVLDQQPQADPPPESVEQPPADTSSAPSDSINTSLLPAAPPSLTDLYRREVSIDSFETVQPRQEHSLYDLYWQLASNETVETLPPEGDAEPRVGNLSDEQQAEVEAQYERDLAQLGAQSWTPEPAAQPPTPEERRAAPGRYTVQVGAFRNKDNADRTLARVRAMGYEAERVYIWYVPGDYVYCVWVGHYDDLDSAAAAAALYSEREAEDAVAVRRLIRK